MRQIERRRVSARTCVAAVVCGCGLFLPGCGANDKPQVRRVVSAYLSALAHEDGDRACAQLSSEAKRDLVAFAARIPKFHPRDCQDVASRLGRLPASKALEHAPLRVSISTDQAAAKIGRSPIAVVLRKAHGRWLIDAFAPASSISP